VFVAVVQQRAGKDLAAFRVACAPLQLIGQACAAEFAGRILHSVASGTMLQCQLVPGCVFGHALHRVHAASTAAAVHSPRS
jgi:hypothetical protein